MPVFEIRYRSWDGAFRSPYTRWLALAWHGVALELKSRWVRRTMLLPWAPVLYFGAVFLVLGWMTEDSQGGMARWVQGLLGGGVTNRLLQHPDVLRPGVWTVVFYWNVQTAIFWSMIMALLVGPGLIARDVRTRAFLIYFSKPIAPAEYLLGKIGIVAFYIGAVTLLPALAMYLVSIAFAPTIDAVSQTWIVLPKVLLTWIVVAVPCVLIILTLSSFFTEPRYAGFAWIALIVLGEVSFGVLGATDTAGETYIVHVQGDAGELSEALAEQGCSVTQPLEGTLRVTGHGRDTLFRILQAANDTGVEVRDFSPVRSPPGGVGPLLSLRWNLVILAQWIFDVPATLAPAVEVMPELKEFADQFEPDGDPRPSGIVLGAISAVCLVVLWRRITAPIRI